MNDAELIDHINKVRRSNRPVNKAFLIGKEAMDKGLSILGL